MRPKAVFFDFDDTLVLTKKADEVAFLKTQELAKEVRPDVDTAQLINDFTSRFTALPWDPANSHLHLERGVEDLIDWLKVEGIAIVVITNGHPDVQRGKLAAAGIEKFVTHILVGGEEIQQGRPEKPAASIFHRACSLVGCQPHEAWHVGDNLYSDIRGAIGAGLAAAVWINPQGRAASEQHAQPTHTIAHISELQDILVAELQAFSTQTEG
ncbi:hypothetical protein WJX84_009462 [Apatococcus fuscideae]|uniref:HAD family hydrolase n=1 Tax=Apatococcus fuscideae TaxID=2026836 RepID=A0AAW1T7A6_9CHLO